MTFSKLDKLLNIAKAFANYVFIIIEEVEKKLDEFTDLGLTDILSKRDLSEFKNQVILTNASYFEDYGDVF